MYISPDLSADELLKEKSALKKRREMINNGVPATELISVEWIVQQLKVNSLKLMFLNARSIKKTEATIKLFNKDPPYMSRLVKILLKKKQQLMRRHKHRDADLVSSQISALLVSNIASDKKAKGSATWWKKVNTLSARNRKKNYAFLSQQKKWISTSAVYPLLPTIKILFS